MRDQRNYQEQMAVVMNEGRLMHDSSESGNDKGRWLQSPRHDAVSTGASISIFNPPMILIFIMSYKHYTRN